MWSVRLTSPSLSFSDIKYTFLMCQCIYNVCVCVIYIFFCNDIYIYSINYKGHEHILLLQRPVDTYTSHKNEAYHLLLQTSVDHILWLDVFVYTTGCYREAVAQ